MFVVFVIASLHMTKYLSRYYVIVSSAPKIKTFALFCDRKFTTITAPLQITQDSHNSDCYVHDVVRTYILTTHSYFWWEPHLDISARLMHYEKF